MIVPVSCCTWNTAWNASLCLLQKELKAHWKRNRSLDLLLPTQRELRRLHRLHIYPLLQENQSVVLVPGAFASNKNSAYAPIITA